MHQVDPFVATDQAQAVDAAEAFPRHGAYIEDPELVERGLARPGPNSGAHRATKRGLDLMLAVLALVVLLPVIALVALLIKLDTPGPVFFRQRRIGRRGHEFGMIKFRTMVDGADDRKGEVRHLNQAADGLFKIHADPRTTRVGSWLRKTSLDELPQLLQVLTGEMSIVGPRPLIPEEDVQIQGPYRCRTQVRPGMTGPWQVAGSSRVPIDEMMELDRDYVENWTVWRDVSLIMQTIPHVVMRRGV
jgi:lipopolysaccharide/colanic/teichoic acid biosynthesis glycosyltransferase